jgi:integrase
VVPGGGPAARLPRLGHRHTPGPRLGGIRLQALSAGRIDGFYADLEEAGAGPATVKLCHAVLGRAFEDARKWSHIPRNPAKDAHPPRGGGSRPTSYTPEEVRRFLAATKGGRLEALWRLAATNGMRRGELAGLTWRSLDLAGASLTVDQQAVHRAGGVSFGPPKSTRGLRRIALDPETVEALRRHQAVQLVERAVAGPAYEDRDLVFPDPLGGFTPPDGLTRRFRRHQREAGLHTGTMHTLRHTAATLALSAGVPVHIVAARLGDRPEQVLSTYSHPLPRSDEVAAARVAEDLA